MKWFTPDLLLRFGSEDDQSADAASDEWEQISKRYADHLRKIHSALPEPARALDRFPLHDARVLEIGWDDKSSRLFIVLRLEEGAEQGVQLDYHLTAAPAVCEHGELYEEEAPLEWLYDELDVLEGTNPPVFAHSILFSKGLEIQVEFTGIEVRPYCIVTRPRKAARADDLIGCG